MPGKKISERFRDRTAQSVEKKAPQEREQLKQCKSLLDECADVVKQHRVTIDKQSELIDGQKEVIDLQDKQIDGLEDEANIWRGIAMIILVALGIPPLI